MFSLHVIHDQGEHITQSFPITKDEMVIGRGNDVDISLTLDYAASHRHARIRRSGNAYTIEDMSSRNGTYLNNRQIKGRILLSIDDHIRIGQSILVFTDQESPPSVAPGSMVVGADDPSFHASMFKADQLAHTMMASETPKEEMDIKEQLVRLTQMSKEVMSVNTEKELAKLLTEELLAWFHVDCCALVYQHATEDGEYEFEIQAMSSSASRPARDLTISRTAAHRVIDEQMALITTNAAKDDRFMAQQSVIARGITSILCAPLWHEDRVFGLVYMDTTAIDAQLNLDHLGLLSAAANLAAIRIDNLRLITAALEKAALEKELSLAAEIQARLLPGDAVTFEDIECVGAHQACLQIGGDYYDFLPRNDDVLTVTIADVTGHGPSSALLMVACKTMLTALVDAGMPLVERVDHLNKYIVDYSTSMQFITFFHAEIDRRTGEMAYCNAGHNAPVLAPAAGDVVTLKSMGMPLGIMAFSYPSATVPFAPGTKLVMYTDGVTEAQSPEEEEYGEARLLALIGAHRTQTAAALKNTILDQVERFVESAEYDDDVTVAVIERTA